MSAAHQVIKRNVCKVIHRGVSLADYHKVDAEYTLSEVLGEGHKQGGAYALCSLNCVGRVEGWHRIKRPGHGLAHIIEHGDIGQSAFTRAFDQMKVNKPPLAILPKKDPHTQKRVRQFECADYLAWEVRNAYDKITLKGTIPERMSLARVSRDIPQEGHIMGEDQLREICERDLSSVTRR